MSRNTTHKPKYNSHNLTMHPQNQTLHAHALYTYGSWQPSVHIRRRPEQPETNSFQANSNESNTNKRPTHITYRPNRQHPKTKAEQLLTYPCTLTIYLQTQPQIDVDDVCPLRPWPCDSGSVGKSIGCSRRWCDFLTCTTRCCQQETQTLQAPTTITGYVVNLWLNICGVNMHPHTYTDRHTLSPISIRTTAARAAQAAS